LNYLLKKGLLATKEWTHVRPLFASLWGVAHVLSNQEQREADSVQQLFEEQLTLMREQAELSETEKKQHTCQP
jgi:hypothetical protein